MKHLIFLFFHFFLLNAIALTYIQAQPQPLCDINIDPNLSVPPSCASKQGYILIFEDEFNTFNSAVWDKSSVGDDLGEYSKPDSLCLLTDETPMNESNVLGPTGGILDLRTQEGEEMNACDYSGAEIKTFNNFPHDSFRDWKIPPNSYIETRLKTPDCDGVGAAFWLRGAIYNRYYEIDVFEYDSDEPYKVKSNVHYGPLNGGPGTDHDNLKKSIICDLSDNHIGMSNQFLTFGVEMTDLYAKIYLNEQELQTYIFGGALFQNTPMNRPLPFNIRLSTGENTHGTNPADCNNLPQYFKIDYVRVYQKEGSKAVNFVGDHPGKVTICVDNDCNGVDYCNWVKANYYPGATYEWESSPFFYFINESIQPNGVKSDDLEQFSLWVNHSNPPTPGDYQLKLTVSFPCNDYKEELFLQIKVVAGDPTAPTGIFLVTDDNNFFYPGTYIANNTSSYEWSYNSGVWSEMPNPATGNKNIWDKFFKSTTLPRQVTICVRAKNACGVSSSLCQTITIPAKDAGCMGCHYQLLPPREVLVEQASGQESYRLKVLKSPYSQSYEWSFEQDHWWDVHNTEGSSFNYFGALEPGLDSFLIYVRGKNQDTLTSVYAQMVATPAYPPMLNPKINVDYPMATSSQPSSTLERNEDLEQASVFYDSYVIYNIVGQIIRSGDWNEFTFSNLRQELLPGIYVLIKSSKDSAGSTVTKLSIAR